MIRALNADELKDLVGSRDDAGFGSLETLHGCLPLTALDVDVHIEGLASKTIVEQRFRNVFDEPLEATYIFPLPPRGAVTGFRLLVNDAVIDGRIDERGKTREDYDAAIAQGRTASIAEQERADVFTLRVGNIPPRATARVELTLVAPLAVDSLEATYRFPLVVASRYCPGVAIDGEQVGDGIAEDTDLVPDASRISPPVLLPGFKSPVTLGIRVRLDAGMIAAATAKGSDTLGCTLCASEHIDTDGSLTVTVVPGQRLDRDFILRWRIATDSVATTTLLIEPDSARAVGLGTGKPTEEAPGDGTFSLVIVPPAQAGTSPQVPRDVVFVLDRSGSMSGWKMVAARRAIARMVDTLTNTDRIAILAFDSSVEHAGDTLQFAHATDRHRWSLLEWLGGIEARGGTELAAALKSGFGVFREGGGLALAEDQTTGRDRVLVLVTDGQVGTQGQVVVNLASDLNDITLFVVGIDTAINEGLLARMADLTGGMVEMVESEDRLDAVMDRIQSRLAAPLVTNLVVQSAGLDVIQDSFTPTRLPNLVPGVPLVIQGRYRGAASGGISIEGRMPTGDSWQEQAIASKASTGCAGSLWARGRLRHLEDLYAKGDRAIDAAALESRIVGLSKAFGVLCKFTAVVAIDPREPESEHVQNPVRRIVQPVELMGMQKMQLVKKFGARPEAPSYSMSASEVFDLLDSFGYLAADANKEDPLEDVRTHAVNILIKACPKSSALADVTAKAIRQILKAALALLKELGECGAPLGLIDSLATAHGRLYALPNDRAALVTMLDTLADIGQVDRARGRWWQASTAATASDLEGFVESGTDDDIPF